MDSNLRQRLQRYTRIDKPGGSLTCRSPVQTAPTDPLFPGEGAELHTPAGSCYVRELCYPLDYLHGPGPLSELLMLDGSGWALPAKDEGLKEVKPACSLFLDIETTGLSGGSGTWAFLIGTAWYEPGPLFSPDRSTM